MAIKIIAVGKKHEPWVGEGIRRYETRLKRPFTFEWVLLPHSAREGFAAREDESERLITRLHPDDFVILLDERGKLLDSPTLSRLLLGPIESSKPVVCIIGGAYGVDDSVHRRADVV
jgi:23S rRNA (pseudouridine1915-N3)-methyltransferase